MNIKEQIQNYIASHDEPKRSDLQALNDSILRISPGCKLWFLDGKDDKGKVVSNPNIGYGSRDHKYADGSVSANVSLRHKTQQHFQRFQVLIKIGIAVIS